jgi:hypothetical protein
MRNSIDDYVYDELKVGRSLDLSAEQIDQIVDMVMTLAENNYENFIK